MDSPEKSLTKKTLSKALFVPGALFLVTSAAIWLKTGAHTGFSKNRVEIQMVDPITQIEYVEYEERFIMGIEYLAAGFFAGLACIAAGFFLGRRR